MKKARQIKSDMSVVTKCMASRWSCAHFGKQSEIELLNENCNTWQTVAVVNSVEDLDAEDLATFIVNLVNHRREAISLLNRAASLDPNVELQNAFTRIASEFKGLASIRQSRKES